MVSVGFLGGGRSIIEKLLDTQLLKWKQQTSKLNASQGQILSLEKLL